jgi:hypothetical protein
MDIIAHAGPVTCRVVFAENGNLLALAEGVSFKAHT